MVERPAPGDWPGLVAGADLMVPSPGVRPEHPAYAAAASADVTVRGDVDLGMEAARVPVVAVTGTNGKSTVTTLIAAILEAGGTRAVAAGNIGRPLLEVVDDPVDVIVVEVSSFQLHATTAAFAPRVAVLLNVADDHLDWHGSFAEYRAVKAKVFTHQRADDVLVANLDDPVVRELAATAPGRVIGVSLDGAAGRVRRPRRDVGHAGRGGHRPRRGAGPRVSRTTSPTRWRRSRRRPRWVAILPPRALRWRNSGGSTTEWSRSARLPGWSSSTTRRRRTPMPR